MVLRSFMNLMSLCYALDTKTHCFIGEQDIRIMCSLEHTPQSQIPKFNL